MHTFHGKGCTDWPDWSLPSLEPHPISLNLSSKYFHRDITKYIHLSRKKWWICLEWVGHYIWYWYSLHSGCPVLRPDTGRRVILCWNEKLHQKQWRLTAEVWSPPLVDFGSSALTGISVGLELITQHMLLAVELTHVIHTALEEGSGIHHTDTLPGTKKTHYWFHLYHPSSCQLVSCKNDKYRNTWNEWMFFGWI